MEATQMNVRIDTSLKRTGDVVLSELGYTPSRVVRALWEYLSVHSCLPSALEHVLAQERVDAEPALSEAGVGERGARIVSSFYERVGVPEPSGAALDLDALRDEWAEEKLAEWGLS